MRQHCEHFFFAQSFGYSDMNFMQRTLFIRSRRLNLFIDLASLFTPQVQMPRFSRQFSIVPALMLAGLLGCSGTSTAPLGRLTAKVVDANDAGVQGILVDLYKMEGGRWILWRTSVTSSNGIGEFGASDGGVVAGDYFIRVRFVTQHQLAPGESNDRHVTVNEGDNIVVTFRVVPKEHELTQIAVPFDFVG
jgi:5-hydroxyisourate hydrolase-like protein (transthyretin family)